MFFYNCSKSTLSDVNTSYIYIFSSSSGSDEPLLQEETEQQRVIRLKRLEKFANTGNSTT